jgi:hypothetical protein
MRKILVSVLSVLALTGCSQTVVVEPAIDSNNPNCAEVMVRLPDEIGEHAERYTSAQATKAWGDPSAVIFRCGLEPALTSPLPCVTAGDVDWLVDDSQAPNFRFISFGRAPAVEVIVDSEAASGITALEAIAPAVSAIEATARCTTTEG